ncbi:MULTISPECIES: phage tail tube protein [Clostridium]|uniref:Phage tail tube protein n=1 Tax=Clostridium frigoriphilum TaxID=443253 RepID=A0ABU7UIX6_9CLOT|nr:phage tail tube protein [Clostridium sp. DSM 17811]MBU3098395.1 phage tail tube protein [Clostridium sp. DSM 17811]
MEKDFSGLCPKYETEGSIEITYTEVNMAGDPRTYYKRGNYRCEKSNSKGCDLKPCPIYSDSPNSL